jgi:hypothetical protein
MLLLVVTSKYAYCSDAGPVAAGFTLYGQATSGDNTPGAGTGNTYLKVYAKQALGTETGTISVTGPSLNTIQAQFVQISGSAHQLELLSAQVNTSSGTWNATFNSPYTVPDTQTGDRVFVIAAVNNGVPTFNTPTPTMVDAGGGATFTWVAQRFGSGQFNGDDCATYVQEFTVSGNATGAVTHTMTASSGVAAGCSIFLRVRNGGSLAIEADAVTAKAAPGYRMYTSAPSQWEALGITFIATKPRHYIALANNSSTVTGNAGQLEGIEVYRGGWGFGDRALPVFSDFGSPQAVTTTATVP